MLVRITLSGGFISDGGAVAIGIVTLVEIALGFTLGSAFSLDTAAQLPSDSSSYGFDNVTVGNLSPTLLESYVSAAEKISQVAVGRPSLSPGGATVRLRPDLTQEKHLEGLPIGTRGGALVSHTFPVNGEALARRLD